MNDIEVADNEYYDEEVEPATSPIKQNPQANKKDDSELVPNNTAGIAVKKAVAEAEARATIVKKKKSLKE